ncbi:MAG TPA: hypothetical protein VIL74_01930 [Pyrinomonadaceae bacterium]
MSGRYEGTAEIEGLGKLAITGEIRQRDGKISGAFQTPLGEAPILSGSFSDGDLRLTIDAGGDDVFFSGRIDAERRIRGEISGAVGKGTFEIKRTGDAAPESAGPVALAQSKEKWRADLRFLATELPKKHKNAFHRITRAEFEKQIAELDRRLPDLSDDAIVVEMSRIVSRIGDGHTSLGWWGVYPRVPLELFWFGKELRVTRAAAAYPRLNGARVTKIGGVAIEKIYERSREYISPGESEQFTLSASADLVTFPVFLKNLGLTNDLEKAVYEFVDLRGRRFSLELRTQPRGAVKDWIVPYKNAPLYLQNPEKPFFFEYLKDAKTVYVNFKWYPRRAEFRKFSAELFDFVDKNDVGKIVFDLRQNGGGDFTRGRDFFIKPLKERKKFLERGRLFVITGRVTYSAGMTNAADFRNDLGAILVGEPTGARPVGYMENRGFNLPNSHFPVSYSIEFYKFSETDTPGITPDRRIEPDWRSFLAGRDPALEWILAYPKF